MKTISSQLLAHMAQPETTLATLWKLIRQDGTILGFTDHDQTLTFTDNTASPPSTHVYTPFSGATGSATEASSDMTATNQDVVGFLDSDQITEIDIFAGLYNYAVIEIRIVNWADLTMGAMLWKRATLGEVKMKNGQLTAELRGLEFYLGTNIGETYGPTCRADLGDARCTIDLSLWIQNGIVQSVTDFRTFVPQASLSPLAGLVMQGSATPMDPAPAAWFQEGVVVWTSGLNTGFSMEVSTWDGTTIALWENMPYAIAEGDTFTIVPGCLHDSGTCFTKFDNIDNYRGEDNIPGMDQLMLYPNADGSV
jgi:uncharacterized phage protein (TIGR02218 family)